MNIKTEKPDSCQKWVIKEVEDDFYYTLQKYSALYRIILAKPYSVEINLNQWNRIDLKLVNEIGLTLKGEQKKMCWLEVGCQLLHENEGQITPCEEYSITYRPLKHDAWEFTNSSDISGFQNDTNGDFEYMITVKDEKFTPVSNDRAYYIQIFPIDHKNQTIKAFPLMIGPIRLFETIPKKTTEWEELKVTSPNMFHGYQLHDHSFLIIKEDWNLGTPGKMWDSALVISQMLSNKINLDPDCFKSKKLLDLSAGTGCVGLLIASIYKINCFSNKNNRPKIVMTDLIDSLDLIYQNRTQNQLEEYTEVKPLEWGNFEHVQHVLSDGPIDTIIASDVLYKPSSFPSLVQTLDWLSQDNANVEIFLGYKRRGLDFETEQTFFNICNQIFDIQLLSSPLQESHISKNEGWILNELSDICKDTGVNIYQLIRKSQKNSY